MLLEIMRVSFQSFWTKIEIYIKRIQHENQYDEFEEMFPGWPPILYVYLGPVLKGVCQKKKKEEEEQFRKNKRGCIDTYCVIYIRKQEKCVFLM